MTNMKHQMIRLIRERAEQEAAYLAGEFARAASQEKEQILAELEFKKWLAESCSDCLGED